MSYMPALSQTLVDLKLHMRLNRRRYPQNPHVVQAPWGFMKNPGENSPDAEHSIGDAKHALSQDGA